MSLAIQMNQQNGVFDSLVPLDWGTNAVVIVATNASGDASSQLLLMERANRFRIVWMPYGGTVPQVLVSQMMDEGLMSSGQLTSVTCNGMTMSMGTPDGDGNVLCSLSSALPLPPPCAFR